MAVSYKTRKELWKLPIHLMFILISISMIVPLIMIVSISISEESQILGIGSGTGFSIFPKGFSLDGYRLAFRNPDAVIKAYGVTAYSAFLGTLISMTSAGMIAYPLARSNFRYKPIMQRYLLITMLFGAGTIPTYIVYTQYYHLGDSLLVYIMPCICGGAGTTFMLRAYIKGLSESLYESAELDGASELRIFFSIVVPLSIPMFAALAFMSLVGRWGDWGTSLVYIRNPDLYTLQYLLQRILSQEQFMKQMAQNPIEGVDMSSYTAPTETLRYAMVIIAAGPMLVAFPFFQKYFSKGLTIGSVKG